MAAVLFIAAAGTGAASGAFSFYDRLQQAEVSTTMVAVDVLLIASSIIGATSAFRALRMGQAVSLATRTGRMLLWAGFATDTVAAVLISVEGVNEISRILESDMPRGEKIGAKVVG